MRNNQISFFDEARRYGKITKIGDPLTKLDKIKKEQVANLIRFATCFKLTSYELQLQDNQ